MATLSLQAPHRLHVWPGFSRAAAMILTVLDVFAEAKLRAIAAHKQYPFVDR